VANLLESAVTYDGLPLSSGGAHSLGRMSGRTAHDAVLAFLSTCAATTQLTHFFTLPQPPEIVVDAEVAQELRQLFPGTPNTFPVSHDRVDEAFAFLDRISPQPTNPWGMAPVWFWVRADFRLRTPSEDVIWPGQDPALFGGFETSTGIRLGQSKVQLSIESKPRINLMLSIPEATDDQLGEVAPWLEKNLPFRMSAKHWLRWSLTRSGTSYRPRRITPPFAM
jgi:hypothetical protein